MPFALMLALAAIAGATTLTYLYEREALLLSRLCAGVCVGLAALGLVGFVVASWLGMTAWALVLAGLIVASPLLLLARRGLRARAVEEIGESVRVVRRAFTFRGEGEWGALVFYGAAALLFWFVFAHAMYQTNAGIFTGVDTNIGDLPFHIAVITGFADGDNFPPQHPEFAGARLTYPFIVDFVTALFVRAGATLEGAMFWQSFALMMSLVGLLHRWALKLTRRGGAALVATALVLLSGGFSWWVFLEEAAKGGRGVFALLGGLEHDYTVMGHIGYHWGNAVTALFVTQRSILLGLALALIVWTLWWQASEKGERQKAKGRSEEEEAASVVESRVVETKKAKGKAKGVGQTPRGQSKRKAKNEAGSRAAEAGGQAAADSSFAFCLLPFAFREMLAAGLIAGLLPLVHAHSFVVMMLMGACLALMQGVAVTMSGRGASEEAAARVDMPVWKSVWTVWRPWVVFAAAASVLALPQMFWATRESSTRAGQFFGWEFGWMHGEENVVWFWLKNTGVFIPLLVAALAWRGREPVVSRKLLFFFLPFVLCFVVPNLYRLSPWGWDNIKVLFYWWVASAPLVALVLARLWRRGASYRALAVCLLVAQTAAGGLDVWRAASGTVERRTFDPEGIAFAGVVKSMTPPRSLILHAPTYNDPIYLTGRRTFLGYPGHVWSHGIDQSGRESELKSIYSGSSEAVGLIARDGIEYVVVGPLEREELKKYGVAVNEAFFRRFTKVGEAGEYRLYKTRP
ncbi:MAG TPA: hypothetical protein VHU19_04375 [Pyrinomonadaceae bacterium]|nr:hypothetical protein [Pyrinomonadaceae bacterium]